ncbi:MAG: hypothetical protein DCO96_07370 [Fluviicola sp. XM-24bin1]|nr:MAG: hypothetical protein DCO96_07370 [Fluviicola sp. XM-24bin1]
MKVAIISFCLLISAFSHAQLSETETLENRAEHEAELRDTSLHMLDSMERAEWQGLDYYDFDTTYQVTARFKKKKGPKFEMPTSTDRLPVYRRYGYIYFEIEGVEYRLTVYQNVELTKREGFEDYLFIPFRDATSGKETYGGGRYMDVRIPEKKEMQIDFNQAYNPYCAYSHKWSCPIPPAENTLKISIKAGEKIPLAH